MSTVNVSGLPVSVAKSKKLRSYVMAIIAAQRLQKTAQKSAGRRNPMVFSAKGEELDFSPENHINKQKPDNKKPPPTASSNS